ncbi:MAG TPA: exonuclease SbcCD subunit D [Mogibacterium sp.]|nr:exonuclease SbcCD subunit D [Mogibacterium sp.]
MKALHISDLHLGKIVNDVNMIEDQRFVLDQILEAIDSEGVDALFVSGDVYDKSNPSQEAMYLFNDFMTELSAKNIVSFIISGNHDSSIRLSYLSDFLEDSDIFISKTFEGELHRHQLTDEYGAINIFLLPFFKLSQAKNCLQQDFKNYDEAIEAIIAKAGINPEERNILLAHQFVSGALTSDSEEIIIGGLEGVSCNVFDIFDYVALGHLHRPQTVGRDSVRYSGSILKYSFSEVNDIKSMSIVNINEKNNITVETKPIRLLRDMKEYKGSYEYLYKLPYTEDYVKITLTDEEVVPDARINLTSIFPNMMRFGIENSKTNTELSIKELESLESLSPIDLFKNFYMMQNNNVEPSDKQIQIISDLITGEEI